MNISMSENNKTNKKSNSAPKKATSKKSTGKKKRDARTQADNVRRGLKHSSNFLFGLFVNVIIVFLIVKLFSYSFNFAYGVFGNVSNHPGSQEYIVMDIPPDSTIMEIGGALQDADIIEDKLVFYAKVKVKGYGDKITSGKFHLSPSMTYDEILNIICNIHEETEEE